MKPQRKREVGSVVRVCMNRQVSKMHGKEWIFYYHVKQIQKKK